MTREKHFHPFAALRFLRKTLAVYLIPLVNVLLERNWAAFWLALRQDAVLFGLLCGVSWVLLQCSSWQLVSKRACCTCGGSCCSTPTPWCAARRWRH